MTVIHREQENILPRLESLRKELGGNCAGRWKASPNRFPGFPQGRAGSHTANQVLCSFLCTGKTTEPPDGSGFGRSYGREDDHHREAGGEFALFEGKAVGLVTIDTYRIAAVEQLKTYAEILNLPLRVVLPPASLKGPS